MAFTREFIRRIAKESDLELPKEFVDALIGEHITARDAHAESQVKEALEKQPTQENVPVKNSEEYKALKKSFDDYKAAVDAEKFKAAKENAYREILKDCNLSEKGIEKALKYADWEKIELDADGKIKASSDHIKAVKEEWGDYVTTTTTTGVKTYNPPANNAGSAKLTKADIYKKDDKGRYVMSTEQRQKALSENPELMN